MKTEDKPVQSLGWTEPAMSFATPEGHDRWLELLARNVRYLRRAQKLSQEALSSRCGIYRTYLSRIETGKCNPSLSVLVSLSNALQVQLHVLLSPAD